MSRSVNITRRQRRRVLKSGAVVIQTRWVLNFREPRSGQRRQLFFDRQKEAHTRRNELITQIGTGSYSIERNRDETVRGAVDRWLADRKSKVKQNTLKGYGFGAALVVGPLLVGTPTQRA